MATLLHRLGKTAYRRWPFFIAGWLVLLIAVITVAAGFSKPMSDAFTIPTRPRSPSSSLRPRATTSTTRRTRRQSAPSSLTWPTCHRWPRTPR
jgi:hypothetical protein